MWISNKVRSLCKYNGLFCFSFYFCEKFPQKCELCRIYVNFMSQKKHLQLFIGLCLTFLTACESVSQDSIYFPSTHFPNLTYLVKDPQVWDYLIINAESISFYANLEDKMKDKPECRIYTQEINDFKQLIKILSVDSMAFLYKDKGISYLKDLPIFQKKVAYTENEKPKFDPSQPFKGLKIAIDPGHIEESMEMAQIEAKFIKMKPSDATGLVPIAFNEANLTLATANLLADKLSAKGAKVLISRPKAGIGLLEMTFNDWYETRRYSDLAAEMRTGRIDSSFMTKYFFDNDATKNDWYTKLYVPIDLRLRAEKINAFCPDMSIIIHYNVHGPNWEIRDPENNMQPTDKNYSMTFVAGSFKAYELQRQEDRIAFLRLLLSDDMVNSINLSEKITNSFAAILSVPTVTIADDLGYLNKSCILTEKTGVYARNLGLTRNIKGVLCYGESLCQDNITESAWLNQRLVEVKGMKTSSRVRMVADAYYEGMLNYIKNQQK